MKWFWEKGKSRVSKIDKPEKEDWEIHAKCFRLDAGQLKKFDEWNKQHLAECHSSKEPYAGAIGGRISWIFTSTGLGTGASVRCGFRKCRDKEFCLTDFSDW